MTSEAKKKVFGISLIILEIFPANFINLAWLVPEILKYYYKNILNFGLRGHQ